MKKTLTLLSIGALVLGAAASAEVHEINIQTWTYNNIPQAPVSKTGAVLALSATLINTSQGDSISYDLEASPVEGPPFMVGQGVSYSDLSFADGVTLELDDVAAGDVIYLDFTNLGNNPPTLMGDYLMRDATTVFGEGEQAQTLPIDYIVVKIDGINFYEDIYKSESVTFKGLFLSSSGVVTADAYVISETCDSGEESSVYGGLVFFNQSVAEEMYPLIVPEPATATLSLLALAGLAARRRRK